MLRIMLRPYDLSIIGLTGFWFGNEFLPSTEWSSFSRRTFDVVVERSTSYARTFNDHA
jgi:hypothetical protein